ncbi:MAG: glycosyltransferase family 9 protein [Vicinamibacterales bacterium]
MKILLVRLRLIGDVVFTTPLLAGLRRRFPDAELTYVVEPAAAPVVLGNPHLTDVVVVPKASGIARLRSDLTTARALRRRRFDVAIDLHGGPRSAWLARLSGAPMRIGYRIAGRSWMYTHLVERPADNGPRHSVLNQWDLLEPLGIEPCDPERYPVEMIEDQQAAERLTRHLERAGIPSSAPLVVVHVSAGNPFRRWPADAFVSVLEQLARQDPTRRIVVTSGPSEASAAEAIARRARQRLAGLADAIASVPEFDLQELHSLIRRSALFIGGDSGPMHIAATTETPIVALLGPTLPERSMPWRAPTAYGEGVDAGPLPCRPCRQRVCEPGDFRCLTRITPERVVAAAGRALASKGRNDVHSRT